MPKIVDHDARRAELAKVAWRLISKHGVDGVTTRQIARESGYSNGVLQHYFETKDDLLLAALQQSHIHIDERYEVAVSHGTALEGLDRVLNDNLPEDEQRASETRVEMSFWGRALYREDLRDVQRANSAKLQALIGGLVEKAQESGELDPGLPVADVTELLHSLIDGISLHVLLYPERFPGTRMSDLMRLVLRMMGARDL